MEKKLVKITVTGMRYTFSVDTFNTRGQRVDSDPGVDSLRNKTNDQALASVIDKFGKNPNYTIKVNGILVNTLPGKPSESLGNRFLRWLDQYDGLEMYKKIG